MTKTPFELRFDTLALARQHLMEQYYAQFQLYELDKADNKTPAPPTYPTPEQVTTLAGTFKSFVDK